MALPRTRLQDARVDAGLSQQALADRVGLAQQNLARYELGIVEPKARMAVRIARALRTTVEAIWLPPDETVTLSNQENDMATTTTPLAMIGKYGRATHAIQPTARGGRVMCESSGPYLTRDADGGYTDGDLHSDFRPLGRNGHPTCSRCLRELAK